MRYTIISCASSFGSILRHTKESGIDIKWAFKGNKSRVLSLIRMIWFKYDFPMKKIWINKSINDLGEVNIVFDSCANEFILRYLKGMHSDKRFIFYYWNSVGRTSLNIEKVRELDYEIWGYDPVDAKNYHYKYNPQFFCPSWYDSVKKSDAPIYDVSFVGRDKYKRMQAVENVMETLTRKTSLTSTIYFTAPHWYLFLFNKKYKRILNFDEMLQKEMSGRILLDITDRERGGYTLRVYDALCNGRKLITNNANIVKEDFYDKCNVFVYGVDSLEGFQTFVNTPFNEDKEDEISSMDITHWLERFI